LNSYPRVTVFPYGRKKVNSRTANQAEYLTNIETSIISFCVGAAGSGKTFLAVAHALEALHKKSFEKIVITKPIVEAGENLGFLPGSVREKVDIHLMSFYDAVDSLIGKEKREEYIEKGIIEIAPLAYMRGRTFSESIIILDEAQNTTVEQLRMILTRLGKRSKIIISGDYTQTDLDKRSSGLLKVIRALENVSGVSYSELKTEDVQRAKIVREVIDSLAGL
jgi:phosphate starvation-inducible PhoH-like protein